MSRRGVSVAGRVLVRLAGALVGVWAYVVFGVRCAGAAEPWWHLDVGARPTLIPGHAVDAEQEITTGESLRVVARVEVEGHPIACLTSELIANAMVANPEFREIFCAGFTQAEVADDASQLQGLLNNYYGGSVVEVTGRVGGEGRVGEGEPLIVTAHGRGLAPIKARGVIGSVSSRVLREGGSGKIVLQAFNLGDAPIDGEEDPVTLTDRLPAGLEAGGLAGATGEVLFPEEGEAKSLTCSVSSVSCTFTGKLEPYERLEVVIWVTRTGAGVPGPDEVNQVEVSGGKAAAASRTQPVRLSEELVPFGAESFEMLPEEEGGAPATQAGGHPFQLTTVMRLNETAEVPFQPAEPRNLTIDLPAGLVANASATPKCSYAIFSTQEAELTNACPADAAIGVASAGAVLGLPPKAGYFEPMVPVFNLTPAQGEPARFGFIIGGKVPVVLDTHLRVGGDYGATVTVQNLSETGGALSSVVTLWGVPGDPVHDTARGWECLKHEQQPGCGPSLSSQKPLLTLPSSCQALQSSLIVQSWAPGASPLEPFPSSYEGLLDGCNREGFEPKLEVQSSASSAFSPTELRVHVHVPQQTSEAPGGIAEADVRSTTVALPAALQVNPAAAGGLAVCSEAQIGYREKRGEQTLFQEESQAERDGEEPHRYGCPEGSKLGTVRVKTPLLEEELTGAVYQAAQDANPFGSLLALYIVAEAPQAGVRIRLAGKVQVEPDGQVVSSFDDTPQTPFEEFELKFFGGGKAPLATSGCGSYQTTSVFESWAGGAPVSPFSAPFSVSSGPDGGSCASVGGFAPGFLAGTASNQAGAFSRFVTTLTRNDGEQTLSTVTLTTPPGLLGMISKVTPCSEAQANAGTCAAASKIGHVVVQAGVGDEPLVLPEAGKGEDPVYLTGPYKGAPFGLSIVVPAEAGPFNLDEGGHPVVVRAKIEVNPITAQITIASDPAPTRLQGIPLDLRAIKVVVDRPEFTFNPTNCTPMSVTGTIGSSEGKSEHVKSRFQAADCASLRFKPLFKAFTRARHSKRKGAYLRVIVKSGPGQANIGRVHVKLPKTLPSRLATLKLACSEAQFAKNPAGCPAASKVGYAKATTPVLPVPLTGPAIFVSHGGAAFPNLDVVLQGDHVTLDLVGNTFISKGVTTSTFAQVPDAPVNRFVLTLPEGPHSALAANGNLCREKPRMPTTITGQNGAVIEQDTKIAVKGCKGANRRGKAHRRHRRKHG